MGQGGGCRVSREAELEERLAAVENELVAVKAERDDYRVVFDQAPLLIWFKDADNVVLRANARAAASAGLSPDEIAGRSTYDLHPEEADGYHADDLEVMRSGSPKLGILERLDTPDGKRWIQTDKIPWRDPEGAVQGVVVLVTDVTERVEIQESLYRAQRMESVGILAGGIAHDFNNLLSGLFGNLQLAERKVAEDHPGRVYLQRASNAIDRARALTRQLLTFSTGGEPKREPVALGPLIADVATFALSGSAIELDLDIDVGLNACLGDREQIAQVLENILVNAAQAMTGSGRLTIRARNRSDPLPGHPGDWVEIEVQDSGPGIAPDDHERIFDPFFTTKPDGTGLGLATAFSIARKHGGLLDSRNALDGGSVFRLLLPLAQAAPPLAPAAPAVSSSAGTGRLLMLDDDSDIRTLVSEAASALSLEVTCVATTAEAVAAFREAQAEGRPFRVAMLDLTIRGDSGGKQALRQLRALDPGLRAIVASGYSVDPALVDPGKHGFDAVLTKPFRLEELRAALNLALF